MIGDLRTDALHRALQDNAFSDQTFDRAAWSWPWPARTSRSRGRTRPAPGIATRSAPGSPRAACSRPTTALLRQTAREMLISVLSCRDNMSNSGVVACVAGAAIDAVAYLPNMATEEFLACLSRAALERSAATEGVRVEVRVKDTRARMVERFKDGIWIYPGSRFTPRPKPSRISPATRRMSRPPRMPTVKASALSATARPSRTVRTRSRAWTRSTRLRLPSPRRAWPSLPSNHPCSRPGGPGGGPPLARKLRHEPYPSQRGDPTGTRPLSRARLPRRTARQSRRPSLGIDRQHLRAIIADRRAALSAIEIEMVGRCEEAAARASAAPRSPR